MNNVADSRILEKKKLILFCGVVIFFVASMSKVLVPATIFNDLLKLDMDVDHIAFLGSVYLYSYAASQLLVGCFSDRYGGVRILLAGGGLFAVGTLGFPLSENYILMVIFRISAGFGAGTIFLGVAKLLADIFPEHFSVALGTVLFVGYLGPSAGTVPMVKLVGFAGWRAAMLIPGIIALCPMLVIIFFMRGTIIPVRRGQTFDPLLTVLKNKDMWYICFACTAVYGVYYALAGQIGQKIFTDIYHLSPERASMLVMLLTIIVAVNNMAGNLLLKIFRGRRKMVVVVGVLLSVSGTVIASLGFFLGHGAAMFLCGTVLIALPAGFFPIFSLVAKELNPPKYTAMAVAFLNFTAFVFISLYQDVSGAVLKRFSPADGGIVFPQKAYEVVFLCFAAGALISLIPALLVRETGNIPRRKITEVFPQ